MTQVAALYVDARGPYPKLARASNSLCGADCGADCECIDVWVVTRDARQYDGPHPVVVHPPCKHWGRLRHLAHVACTRCAWTGPHRGCSGTGAVGDELACPKCGDPVASDADCAPRAVEQVRRWGGVLEHPAGSKLWEHCGLPYLAGAASGYLVEGPSPEADRWGGYTIELDQVEWGHVARKRTWLYLVGVPRTALEAPPFPGREPTHHVSRDARRARRNGYDRKRTSSAQNLRTPPLFAEYLIRLARAVQR